MVRERPQMRPSPRRPSTALYFKSKGCPTKTRAACGRRAAKRLQALAAMAKKKPFPGRPCPKCDARVQLKPSCDCGHVFVKSARTAAKASAVDKRRRPRPLRLLKKGGRRRSRPRSKRHASCATPAQNRTLDEAVSTQGAALRAQHTSRDAGSRSTPRQKSSPSSRARALATSGSVSGPTATSTMNTSRSARDHHPGCRARTT